MFTKQTPLPPQQPRGFLERVINTAGIGAPRPPARGNNQAVANRWMAAQANQRRRMRQEQARQWQENVRAGIAPPGTTRAPEAPAEGIWVSPQGVEVPTIRWGAAPPINAQPKPFKWGGEQFSLLEADSRNNLIELYPIVHSIYGTSVTIQAYKFFLNPLTIIYKNQINNIIKSILNSSLTFYNCKTSIRKYWLEDINRNYPIEPIELYIYIFNWMHRNSFQDQRYTIFPEEITIMIRDWLFPAVARPPVFNENFKRNKIQYIRILFEFPDMNPDELLIRIIQNVDEQNEFKRLLLNELDERENIIDTINMFLETFPDGVIKEDCESLCYMIERTTLRFRALNPDAAARAANAREAARRAAAAAVPAVRVNENARAAAGIFSQQTLNFFAHQPAPVAVAASIFNQIDPFKQNATSITNKFYLFFSTNPDTIDNIIIDRLIILNLIDEFTKNDMNIVIPQQPQIGVHYNFINNILRDRPIVVNEFAKFTEGLKQLMVIFDLLNNESLKYIEEQNKYVPVKKENQLRGGNKTRKNRKSKRSRRTH